MRSATMPTTISSETRSPRSMTSFAFRPTGEPDATAERSISPVESCGMPYRSTMRADCVPFPAPGGPSRMILIGAFSLTLSLVLSRAGRLGKEVQRRRAPFSFDFFTSPSY